MEQLRERFLATILNGDFAAASAVAQEVRSRGLPVLYEELVMPALVEVGRLWQTGKISVGDEHIATAVVQSVLASMYPTFPWATTGPKGVVTCVAGERHELGARMAADLLACDGWNVIYAGADLPIDALLALVARVAPVFVGLSVGLPERLAGARDTAAQLRAHAPGVKVILGGRALAADPRGAADYGVDAIARSATSAVATLRAWRPS